MICQKMQRKHAGILLWRAGACLVAFSCWSCCHTREEGRSRRKADKSDSHSDIRISQWHQRSSSSSTRWTSEHVFIVSGLCFLDDNLWRDESWCLLESSGRQNKVPHNESDAELRHSKGFSYKNYIIPI